MSLTKQDVERVAYLSRLKLNENEIEKFQTQLTNVLGYIDLLNELDTTGLEPTLSITGSQNRLREDKTSESFSQEEALYNAPNKTEQYFIAPYVFE